VKIPKIIGGTCETQEIAADYFALVQFSPNVIKVLCVGQVEEKGSYHI
jgi:hypothetical protein